MCFVFNFPATFLSVFAFSPCYIITQNVRTTVQTITSDLVGAFGVSFYKCCVFLGPSTQTQFFFPPSHSGKLFGGVGVCVFPARGFSVALHLRQHFFPRRSTFSRFFFQFECCPYKTLHSHRKAADGFTLGVLFWFRLKFTSLVRSGELYSGRENMNSDVVVVVSGGNVSLVHEHNLFKFVKNFAASFQLDKVKIIFPGISILFFFFAEVYIQQNFLPKSIGSFKNPSPRRRQKFPQISLPKSIAFPRFLWWRADSAESLPRRRYVRCGFLGPVVGIDRVIGNNVKWHIEGGRGWAVCVFSTWSDNVTRTVSGGDFD